MSARRRGGSGWPPAVVRFGRRLTEVPSPADFSLPCWQWDVLRPTTGYGDFYDGRAWLAHRWSYEHHVGPIPEGLEIDHLCRNRGCVNPYHLEVVTPRVNTLRGFGPSGLAARKTQCSNGHAFTPENTYYRGPNRQRRCRTCVLAANARQYAKRKAA